MNEVKHDTVYPLFALPECFRVAEAVRDLGGARSPVRKSSLAQHLKFPESSPSFSQRLGAAKAFKLIEGHGSYSLSDAAKRYFYPISESQKAEAGLEILSSPLAFQSIIRRFSGDKLPTSEIIANIVHREAGVPLSWKDRTASFFRKSAEFLGVVDAEGFLRYGNENAVSESKEQSIKTQPAMSDNGTAQQIIRTPRKVESPPPGYSQWVFPFGGSYIRLETPEALTKELWDKLNAYVQILKPSDETK